jgi:hypothetical protein
MAVSVHQEGVVKGVRRSKIQDPIPKMAKKYERSIRD